MSAGFHVSIRFLQPYSHGRGEDGTPEWPPSPLRLFQALVANSIGREPSDQRRSAAAETLRWLEQCAPPQILAPPAVPVASPYRSYVPDNVADKVAKSWSAGREGDLAEYRSEKDIQPMRLDGEAVHYLFDESDGVAAHLPTLKRIARAITHVGWGIDHVVADAGLGGSGLDGERWLPERQQGRVLRSPIPGTFAALEHRHQQFLTRLEGGMFRPVSPLSTYGSVRYARATDPVARPFAAFRLVAPITGDRLSFEATRRTRDVAAWMRHAVAEITEGWPFGSTRTLVHGHTEEGEKTGPLTPRLAFLPLPTINPRLGRVEGIARVLVCGPAGLEEPIAWLRAQLSGREFEWGGKAVGMLEPLPDSDWVLGQYVNPSTRWSTVTPVVLPGHDDRSPRKIDRLLRRAFAHAGFEPEFVDSIRILEYRKVAFRAGAEHAARYLPPDKVIGPMFHVRVEFAKPVTGPLAIGSGRFRGMGVFAGTDSR